jgi:hypothetical protein
MIKGQHTCVENPNLPGKSRLPTGCYGSCLHLFKVAIYAARSATSFLDMLGIFWMWIEQESAIFGGVKVGHFRDPKNN